MPGNHSSTGYKRTLIIRISDADKKHWEAFMAEYKKPWRDGRPERVYHYLSQLVRDAVDEFIESHSKEE